MTEGGRQHRGRKTTSVSALSEQSASTVVVHTWLREWWKGDRWESEMLARSNCHRSRDQLGIIDSLGGHWWVCGLPSANGLNAGCSSTAERNDPNPNFTSLAIHSSTNRSYSMYIVVRAWHIPSPKFSVPPPPEIQHKPFPHQLLRHNRTQNRSNTSVV